MGHHQCPGVVLKHALEEPHHPALLGGELAHHPHAIDLGLAHAGEAAEAVRIASARQGHRVDGCLGIPGLAPQPHGPDLVGLIAPDRLAECPCAGLADVEDELTHAQGARVVLHHPVDEAQVVGAAGRAHIVVVGAVIDRR